MQRGFNLIGISKSLMSIVDCCIVSNEKSSPPHVHTFPISLTHNMCSMTVISVQCCNSDRFVDKQYLARFDFGEDETSSIIVGCWLISTTMLLNRSSTSLLPSTIAREAEDDGMVGRANGS